MKERNKDNIENFFKENSQNYHFEFNEGDWQKLEAQLDKEMPVAFTFWSVFRKYWPVMLLVLMIPGSWYAYRLYSDPEENTRNITSDEATKYEIREPERMTRNSEFQESRSSKLEEPSVMEEPSLVEEPSAFPQLSENMQDDGTFSSDEKIAGQNGSLNEGKNESAALTGGPVSDKLSTGVATSSSGNQINSFISPEGFTGSEENTFDTPGSISILTENTGRSVYPPLSVYPFIDVYPMDPLAVSSDDPGRSEDPGKKQVPVFPDNIKEKNRIAFYAGIGFSPDFSTVGLGNFIAPGFRWNVQGEVAFSKRLHVNTGIVYVKNKYEAYGEDYHAPPRYWKNGIVASEAYGECIMLDIPLNIRYDVLHRNGHQLFISGGASTYFLMKEDYYFTYANEDPDLPHYWGTDKVSIYPFGIVNLSLGYQYQLGRRGALQVEPFIKLPTGGIGWGNVDLHTIGMYFLYKYRVGR